MSEGGRSLAGERSLAEVGAWLGGRSLAGSEGLDRGSGSGSGVRLRSERRHASHWLFQK